MQAAGCFLSLSGWRGRRVAGVAFIAASVLGAAVSSARTAAPAAPVSAGMQAPAEVAAVLPQARLQGRGTLRFFGLAVYEVRLWVGPDFVPERYDGHAFALEFRYARKLGGAAIAERSLVAMRRIGDIDETRAKAWLDAMTRAFPDVAPGDRLTGVYLPTGTTSFHHNGRPTTTITDAGFGRLFFGIWLADSSSEPALRRRLIGPGS